MPVMIAMLRGVNVGGRNMIKMDALRELCGSLDLRRAVTHLQSGNVVFDAPARSIAKLASKLESAIEGSHGFRPSVILRTPAELERVIAADPFAARKLDPAKLLVYFLASDPGAEALAKVAAIKNVPEEVHFGGRELYIYFTIGMARPKLSLASVDRILKTPATGRNWNTVEKLLEIANRI
jgi:uncharacterized protein (DUF1697 family)